MPHHPHQASPSPFQSSQPMIQGVNRQCNWAPYEDPLNPWANVRYVKPALNMALPRFWRLHLAPSKLSDEPEKVDGPHTVPLARPLDVLYLDPLCSEHQHHRPLGYVHEAGYGSVHYLTQPTPASFASPARTRPLTASFGQPRIARCIARRCCHHPAELPSLILRLNPPD